MIEFKIRLPDNDKYMTDEDIEKLMSFIHSLHFHDFEYLLEGNVMEYVQDDTLKIIMERSSK